MESDPLPPGARLPQRLLEGYRSFHAGRLPHERQRYARLAHEGQKPETMIISCCDSRAGPEIIFDAAPGELFVLRNVANLVPPCQPDGEYHGTSAALEFAVLQLRVRHILVMGHGRCGGIQAFRDHVDNGVSQPPSPGDFIGKWISLLEPARMDLRCTEDADAQTRQRAMEEAAIRNSLANLMTFPSVAALVGQGQLELHGAWFDISDGQLWIMDPETGEFSPFAG